MKIEVFGKRVVCTLTEAEMKHCREVAEARQQRARANGYKLKYGQKSAATADGRRH